MTNKEYELREALSENIHDMWVKWTKILSKEENFSEKRIKRWKKLYIPYNELSEKMKNVDRKIVDTLLKTVRRYK